MTYKLIIFDFDGTLADSFPYFLRTMNTLATMYSFPTIDTTDVDRLRGLDARQMMKRANLPAWKVPLIARSFIQLMKRDIDQIRLFDGIPELLRNLATQGVKLAIVSSNSEENVRQVLGHESASLISYYGCGTSLFMKQHKFKRAMAKANVKPEETLCIGDEVRDKEAAQKAATAFGGVAWGYTRPDVLAAQPNMMMFYSPEAIAEAVLQH
ncbi:phosphoglycolate phosphatase [Fibrella aestuarina BUZ 2]|uniref:Phosphoglycolate phosphatase n=1 Tax=Fibrella aestuarina BUZ 2 TaxID=1166018 RepID=I0KCB4_9BACT|nr:HAD hydrolase-like protein [Fibrella aestuarina]CCH01767.1 phosphoglycolate phosphatase [Fibrella aestuarina BUZ 2]